MLDTARAESSHHALCYLDLDQFKIVNDSCGHNAGDALLSQLGALLKSKIRWRDTLARLGLQDIKTVAGEVFARISEAYNVLADDDKRGKAEALAAFHRLGDTVDVHQLIGEFIVAVIAIATAVSTWRTCHALILPLEIQATVAGGVGERFDAPVIKIAAAVENDIRDASRNGARDDAHSEGWVRASLGRLRASGGTTQTSSARAMTAGV